jgi:pimeloyl-ACP methyl ester carboxylesterase
MAVPSALKAFFKFILGLLKVIACIYALLVVTLFFNQETLLFFPSHNPETLPAWTASGRTLGVQLPCEGTPKRICLLLHGNGSQAGNMAFYKDLLPEHTALFILEYPGFGAIPRAPSFDAINAAATVGCDDLRRRYPKLPLILIGQSVGTGPASLVGAQKAADAVVLVTPYDDFPSLAQEKYPFMPAERLTSYRWNNAKALKKFKGHIIIVGARDDLLIPVRHARHLAQELPQAHYFEVAGGHNDYDRAGLKEALLRSLATTTD